MYKADKSITMEPFWVDTKTYTHTQSRRSDRLSKLKENNYESVSHAIYTRVCSDKNISEIWTIFLASASDRLKRNFLS